MEVFIFYLWNYLFFAYGSFIFYFWKNLLFTCETFYFLLMEVFIFALPIHRKEKAMKRLGLMFPGSTLDVSSIMTIGRPAPRKRLYLKGLCHEMTIFLKAYINNKVLSVHALIVLKIFCFLVWWKNKTQSSFYNFWFLSWWTCEGHGDFWSNNIMFSRGDDGEPDTAVILDFQVHYNEISIYVFVEKELHGPSPNSYILCLWDIYIFPGSVHIFVYRKIDRLILETYKSLTDSIWV